MDQQSQLLPGQATNHEPLACGVNNPFVRVYGPQFLIMLSRSESILYSSSQTENVPTWLKKGIPHFSSVFTKISQDINKSKCRVRVQCPSWFKEGQCDSIMYIYSNGMRKNANIVQTFSNPPISSNPH